METNTGTGIGTLAICLLIAGCLGDPDLIDRVGKYIDAKTAALQCAQPPADAIKDARNG